MTAKAFVIGHPIGHSLSPSIHGYWLDRHGVEGTYSAHDVAPADLEAFLSRVRQGAFVGGNVTIPHKEAVMALCDHVDPRARAIGAVNTIEAREGRLLGSNTDEAGFLANLDQGAKGWDTSLEAAIVLGAGGAARAIVMGLAARGVARIHVLNRTPERALKLAQELNAPIVAGTLEDYPALAPGARLLVNTSSVGMGGTRFEGLDLSLLPHLAIVTDAVYTPLVTPLLSQARARGLHIVDGLGMLLWQAVPGFKAWFGIAPEVDEGLRGRILQAMGNK